MWGNNLPSKLYYKKTRGVWESKGFDAEFNPKTLEAYHGSFVLLKRINGRLLITSDRHSYFAQTVASILKGKHKVTWISTHCGWFKGQWHSNHCSLDKLKTEGLKSRFEELYWLKAQLNKKGIRQMTKDGHRKQISLLEREIKDLAKLGAGFPLSERKKLERAELNRVADENAAYAERAKRARNAPRIERDPIAAFKAELLENSFRNV